MRRVWNKTQQAISREWDDIAELRSQQIRSGKDISYDHILVPTIVSLIATCDRSHVLDVGCGCGFMTAKIAETAEQVTGIDISPTSVRLAKGHCKALTNVHFVNSPIEDLRLGRCENAFSLAIANMSLMAILHLEAALEAISSLVRVGGHLAFTITHPCFWPQYWRYPRDWFCYGEENVIEAPFHISLDQSDQFTTTHVHRPLESYISALMRSNFGLVRILEPMPAPAVERLYPHPWEYPRFLGALCVRAG